MLSPSILSFKIPVFHSHYQYITQESAILCASFVLFLVILFASKFIKKLLNYMIFLSTLTLLGMLIYEYIHFQQMKMTPRLTYFGSDYTYVLSSINNSCTEQFYFPFHI